jgi:hypothetical protein
MREQPFDGDVSLALRALEREPGQVTLDRVVQAQLAPVALLHHGHAGEDLGDGADAVQRLGGGGAVPGDVGPTEAAAPQHLLVMDDRRGNAGHLVVGLLALEPDPRELERLHDVRMAGDRGRRRRHVGG